MKVRIAIAAVMLLTSTGTAWADDLFMKRPPEEGPKETVYATTHHMGFSMRVAVIGWLGGVAVADERDLRSSAKEKWWGETVPLMRPEVVKASR